MKKQVWRPLISILLLVAIIFSQNVFQSPVSVQADSIISDIIQHNMYEHVRVTVDGNVYYIVTLTNYIDPKTWGTSPLTGTLGSTKVYVDSQFNPVLDAQIANKIGLIDTARRFQEKNFFGPGAQQSLSIIDERIKEHGLIQLDEKLLGAAANAMGKAIQGSIFGGVTIPTLVVSTAMSFTKSIVSDPNIIADVPCLLELQTAREDLSYLGAIPNAVEITDYAWANEIMTRYFSYAVRRDVCFNVLNGLDDLDRGTKEILIDMGVKGLISILPSKMLDESLYLDKITEWCAYLLSLPESGINIRNYIAQLNPNIINTQVATNLNSASNTAHARYTMSLPQHTPEKLPDLTIPLGSIIDINPASVEAGQSISVSYTVKNIGNITSGSFTNRISLDSSHHYGTDIFLANVDMLPLGSGSSRPDTESVVIPPDTIPGTYYVTVYTDCFQVVDKVDQNNNNNIGSTYDSPYIKKLTVTAPADVDLSVSSVSAPPSADIGDTIGVDFSTVNSGTKTSGNFRCRVFLSTTPSDMEIGLGIVSINSLPGGAPNTSTSNIMIPPGVSPGSYYIVVYADALDSVDETDENNNINYTPFTVGDSIPSQYNLTMAVSGSGNTTPQVGTSTFSEGTTVEITATASGGEWSFSSWIGDVMNPNVSSTYVIMNSNKTITAHFVKSIPSPGPIIVSDFLPGGYVGYTYYYPLQASNGNPPYSWSITSGSLPSGLALDSSSGLISGTPTSAGGPFDITFATTDSLGKTYTKLFYLTIVSNVNSDLYWQWQNPLPQGNYLSAIWGSSASDIFVAGYQGTIYHYDGNSWRSMSSESSLFTWFYGIWGSSHSNVFTVGGSGTILRYNGARWDPMVSGTSNTLSAVWGTSGDNVFAVGENGIILHYDGVEWLSMSSPTGNHLWGLWGNSSDEIYAVGDGGTIIRFDGSVWTAVDSGTSSNVTCIWGNAGVDIFAAGSNGTVLRFDGNNWTTLSTGISSTLNAIWGSNSSDVFAVGDEGTIIHFDGSNWSASASSTTIGLWGVWGSSGNNIYAVGYYHVGSIFHYDGSSWSPLFNEDINNFDPGYTPAINKVFGFANNNVFCVGTAGNIKHYDGITWENMISGTTKTLFGIWGNSPGSVFAVGADGVILHFDGNIWQVMESGTTKSLRAIWGSDDNDVYAAGWGGIMLHYDGSSWHNESAGLGTMDKIYDIWGSSENNIFAVGEKYSSSSPGLILHFDGLNWASTTIGSYISLSGVWGSSDTNVFAVGSGGTILRYDGSNWNFMPSAPNHLSDIWGVSGSNVFAVGVNGNILHYDGINWISLPVPTANDLRAIWGTDVNNIFTAGNYNTILHHGLYITTSPAMPNGEVGIPYTYTLAAVGGIPPYTWNIISGTLPPGLSFNSSTGVVNGEPTAVRDSTSVTFRVTDTASTIASKPICITIVNTPNISTESLPDGEIGKIYSLILAATGGTSPYVWSVTDGALPNGLSLNPLTGAIEGIPNTISNSNFIITVTDSNNSCATKHFSINIKGIASSLSIITDASTPESSGNTFGITVKAEDQIGFTDMSCSSTIHFTSSDDQAILPEDYTFTSADAGTANFPVTLKTAGNQSLTVVEANNIFKTKAIQTLVLTEGNDTLSDTIYITVSNQLQINLHAGWNMVSTPLMLGSSSVSAVFPGAAAIYTWDPVSKSYMVPTTIEPDKGYWVAVTQDGNITVTGVSVTTWTTNIKAGWNMTGSVINNASINSPNDNPDNSVQPFAYWWNPVGKGYIYTTDIEPGNGYWVASVQDCTLTVP